MAPEQARGRPDAHAAIAARAGELLEKVRDWPSHAAATAKLQQALAPGK
jgi:hypothetical protein